MGARGRGGGKKRREEGKEKRKSEAPWPGRNEVKRRVSNAWGGDAFFCHRAFRR